MKNLFLAITIVLTGHVAFAQIGVKYDPTIQSTSTMQYFKPKGNLFVGDCIPFSLDGTYYYYWLLDSAHHASLNGLGGHQWALSTSSDLKTWKQYPIVLGIDEPWEKSICTGSVAYYKGKYYAFYATRLVNAEGNVNEQLSYAISKDGIHFDKQKPNPFYTSAPGYSKRNFRDPKVFVDQAGEFHLFVSSDQEDPVMKRFNGCLVHLSSKDLKTWTLHDPILTGQKSSPECPDYFFWKGWYYLVYSDDSNTSYVKSKKPYGPWEEPRYQALDEDWSNVVKTASFKNDRRIAAAWVPNRKSNQDNEHEIFGGNSLFREVTQEPDGTLNTSFPAEMIPETGTPLNLKPEPMYKAKPGASGGIILSDGAGVASARITHIPENCRITLTVKPTGLNQEYGLVVKADEKGNGGYKLNLSSNNKTVSLGNTSIYGVNGLESPVKIDLVMKDGILDADIDHRRTIVNRTYQQNGNTVWLYAKHGTVEFLNIEIRPLAEDKQ
ncbi:MAG: family 43 glycosylhydrolase [Mucilaginibacter sp.]|nr:family 43 glycosylhydrolase [Mucilaginibacter sp.]